MSNYVNDLWPGSPRHQDSPSASASGRSSRPSSRSRSRSSSRSRSWSRSSSRRSRSRSHSRSRRRQRRFRRYSRSYSRSRSRTRSRRFRHGYGARPRRDRRSRSRSPPRSRSRSRSRGGWRPRRAFPADPRARRHYGFGRTVDPEELRRRRARSRSRSRSHSPFRLSEKDRMELLEIAKANAAKALGTTNLILPPSLQAVLAAKDTSQGAKTELSEKETEDETKYPTEKSQQRNIAFSSNNSVAKPIQKTANAVEATSSGSPKIDKKKSPYGLWIPV